MLSLDKLLWRVQGEMLSNMLYLLDAEDVGTAQWQLRKLQDLGLLQEANRNIFLYRDNTEEIRKAVEKEITKRAKLKISDTNKEATNPYRIKKESMEKTLAMFERIVGNKLEFLYQGMLTGMGRKYVEIVNVATAKVALGQSGRKAMDEIVRNWIGQGLPMIQDRGGKQWTAEAYAQTLVRSTSNEMAFQVQMDFCIENDNDLVEVSSHLGARPMCFEDQGKVYSLSGTSTKYPPFSSTSYGEPGGLFGVNCRHTMAPYVDGLEKTWKPYSKTENDKVYEESQEQRRLEREVRKAKKAGLAERVRQKEQVLQEYVTMTERRRETGRERVGGRE